MIVFGSFQKLTENPYLTRDYSIYLSIKLVNMSNEKPIIAQKSPIAVQVEAGKNYAWCTCGKSENQPLCDGKHKGSSFSPKIVKYEESKEVWFCACKQTGNELGQCDGTHNGL